ncbi:MAG: site-2 protease family protein [Nitrospiraceae bacterium]|nr:site-2 protease family protein [Nitrospiraceae bacterium]
MRRIPWLHAVLFILTFFSTLAVGALHEGVNIFNDPFGLYRGLPFSVTLLCILMAHELSHYLLSRRHRVEATLPYFIPAPTLFGTLGAFIKMKSPIETRNALMDIGASGPIAGFVISVAATAVGLFFSKVVPVQAAEGMITLGDSLLFKGLLWMILGSIPQNHDVFLHPVALAGWIGFFVTSINLLPIGQLDGGHIAYALLGERHALVSKMLVGLMIIFGIFMWEGWMVWAVLLIILGLRHPPIIYPYVPLDPLRRKIGWASLIIFILTFTPVPITVL